MMKCVLYSEDHGDSWQIVDISQLEALTPTGRDIKIDKEAIYEKLLITSN
jgi:hypothetical protein